MPFRTDEALFDPRTYVPEPGSYWEGYTVCQEPTCNGSGKVDHPLGHRWPCPRCKGWGLLKPGTPV